jgi:lysine N6-hydroxylase
MSDPLSVLKRVTKFTSNQLQSVGDSRVLDYMGIGLGPFNLGLAALLKPVSELDGMFVDSRAEFNWHPGLMLTGTRLQTPFMADLVTMADPTSPYSFLNYAKQKGHLYSFCIRENLFLLREEYNAYCQWVVAQLTNLRFSSSVQQVHFDQEHKIFRVLVQNEKTKARELYRTKKIILGTGTSPLIPESFSAIAAIGCHSGDYKYQREKLLAQKNIVLVGGGQSAAEIFFDLLQQRPQYGFQLHWLTRSSQFYPLEYNKLTLEYSTPDYLRYFLSLPQSVRKSRLQDQAHLYKGINRDLLDSIFDLLYEQSLKEKIPVSLHANSELLSAKMNSSNAPATLNFIQREQDRLFTLQANAVIFATGYVYKTPAFLAPVKSLIRWDENANPKPDSNYAVDLSGNCIFAQNIGLETHGFVTPDLSMAAYRNSIIVNQLAGRRIYKTEEKTAFQDFFSPMDESLNEPEFIKFHEKFN